MPGIVLDKDDFPIPPYDLAYGQCYPPAGSGWCGRIRVGPWTVPAPVRRNPDRACKKKSD